MIKRLIKITYFQGYLLGRINLRAKRAKPRASRFGGASRLRGKREKKRRKKKKKKRKKKKEKERKRKKEKDILMLVHQLLTEIEKINRLMDNA